VWPTAGGTTTRDVAHRRGLLAGWRTSRRRRRRGRGRGRGRGRL